MLDTGHHIRYHAHHHLAWGEFAAAGVLTTMQFDLVDWQMVHNTLSTNPRMFQVWACKQVWSIVTTNYELLHWMMTSPLCPACMSRKSARTSSIAITLAGGPHFFPRLNFSTSG
jgi:hypothetical protein